MNVSSRLPATRRGAAPTLIGMTLRRTRTRWAASVVVLWWVYCALARRMGSDTRSGPDDSETNETAGELVQVDHIPL